ILPRARSAFALFASVSLVLVGTAVARELQGAEQPGEGVWRNYDFTPGAQVWFASDFTDEPVGRFPGSQLEFLGGNMEIVTKDGEKVLEVSANSEFAIGLPEALPGDFSLEFSLQTGAPNLAVFVLFTPRETAWNRYMSQYLHIYQRPGIAFQGQPVASISGVRSLPEGLTPVKLQVDGDYAILYVGGQRAANIPNANFITGSKIHFIVSANDRRRAYLKDFVVAVGVEDMYEKLMETGAFTTRGILFDFNEDQLRPESTPVLEQIHSMLESHPEIVQITIEGHTDSVGEEEYNQALSERRAQTIKRYLEENGIDGDRIAVLGMGETEPVSDNTTAAGRAENRRVVIRISEG
ncbi:OmpA family protein, partial [bacterium]|nr:OmpA family protein [bacterium]